MWYRKGADKKFAFLAGGFAEVVADRVSILAQVAERADDIDLARAEALEAPGGRAARAAWRSSRWMPSAPALRCFARSHAFRCHVIPGRAADALMMTVSSAVASHPGLRREENEDAYCVRKELGLFMVADGMGGHAAGEIASKMAVEVIEAFINDTRDADVNTTWPFPYDTSLTLEGNRLKAAFRLANRRLASAMEGNDNLRGMATTAAAVLLGKGSPVVAHVGDSRVYLWREGLLHQITQDHSWVSEQVRAGILSENDARRHPWRNVVTRALAGGDDPQVDVAEIDVKTGDRLLLCSDGLSGVVPPERLEELVGQTKSLEETVPGTDRRGERSRRA